jgi:hypothetical protein
LQRRRRLERNCFLHGKKTRYFLLQGFKKKKMNVREKEKKGKLIERESK